ncbi:hypothetical protein [Oceanobacillus sp. FSL K6-0251]
MPTEKPDVLAGIENYSIDNSKNQMTLLINIHADFGQIQDSL